MVGLGLFKKKLRDPVRGTARVLSATGADPSARFTPIDMMLVVQAPGVSATSVMFKQSAARTKKFPFPGQVIPVEVDRTEPTRVRVIWDEMPTQEEFLKQQGQNMAAQMRGEPADGQSNQASMNFGSSSGVSSEAAEVIEQLRKTFPGATVNVTNSPEPTAPDAIPQPTDRIGQLERLAKLADDGVLTAEEFEKEKSRLLNGGTPPTA